MSADDCCLFATSLLLYIHLWWWSWRAKVNRNIMKRCDQSAIKCLREGSGSPPDTRAGNTNCMHPFENVSEEDVGGRRVRFSATIMTGSSLSGRVRSFLLRLVWKLPTFWSLAVRKYRKSGRVPFLWTFSLSLSVSGETLGPFLSQLILYTLTSQVSLKLKLNTWYT